MINNKTLKFWHFRLPSLLLSRHMMMDRLALLCLCLLTMAGSRSPRPDPTPGPLSGSGAEVAFVNTSGLVRVREGEEAVMECVTRNLANNHLVSEKDVPMIHSREYPDIWALDKMYLCWRISRRTTQICPTIMRNKCGVSGFLQAVVAGVFLFR